MEKVQKEHLIMFASAINELVLKLRPMTQEYMKRVTIPTLTSEKTIETLFNEKNLDLEDPTSITTATTL